MKPTLAAAVAVACTVPAVAQDWSQLLIPTPTPAYAARMAFAEDRAALVLFGGLEADDGVWPPPAPLAETWEFANGAWTQRTTATVPPARSQHVMCYDAYRDHVVVFGGVDANGSPLNDVWWYDGNDWQTQYYSTAPAPRLGAAAYANGSLTIVGGWSPVLGTLGDMWSWSQPYGWHQNSAQLPPRRRAALGRVWTTRTWNGNAAEGWVLHGGVDDQGTTRSETFVLNGSWQLVSGAGGPARSEHAIVYHHPSRSTLLVGGRGPTGGPPPQGDLWRFDDVDWSELPTPTRPPATIGAAVTFDPLRDRLVLVSGATDAAASQLNGEHWEFAPAITTETFGSSCSYFPPTSSLYAGLCQRGSDWQGTVFVSPGNNLSWALFVVGFSNASWNGTPLPMSLSALGIPNCDLLVAPAITLAAAVQSPGPFVQHHATFSLPIPNDPAAYGADLYAQALIGSSAHVLVTSPGLHAVVW
ncbi:MAG: hypothetical protein KAI24_13855 [Planctomycetes bacterium]|nr:hypothetical protein [Planctomycetota bacterium]